MRNSFFLVLFIFSLSLLACETIEVNEGILCPPIVSECCNGDISNCTVNDAMVNCRVSEQNWDAKTFRCRAGYECFFANEEYICLQACPQEQELCGLTCKNLNSDNENCGECGNKCNVGETCTNGSCELGCIGGQILCGDVGSQKCIDPKTDNGFCGANGSCKDDGTSENTKGANCTNGTTCSGGKCDASCGYGTTRCEENGIALCADLKTNKAHCGACNTPCTTADVPNSTMVECNDGCKAFECALGYYLLNGECVLNDVQNCGRAGNACSNMTGWNTGKCTDNVCVAESCLVGYHVDGGKCVADTIECCGASCFKCENGQMCSGGSCSTTCAEPLKECKNTCVNYSIDVNNCGACGKVCNSSTVPNGTAFYCSNSTCKASACTNGYYLSNGACLANSNTACGGTNCTQLTGWIDGNCTNNSCVATSCSAGYFLSAGKCIADSNACCGAECKKCVAPQICSNGACATSCASPLFNCSDTCVNRSMDVNNCGTCGRVCNSTTVPDGTAFYCDKGNCKASACKSGYYLINSTCKLSTVQACGSATNNCTLLTGWAGGTCTNNTCMATSCSTGYLLQNGKCVEPSAFVCPEEQLNCSGVCKDYLTDNNHCGACNNRCTPDQKCYGAYCVLQKEPYPNFVLCEQSMPPQEPYGPLSSGFSNCASEVTGKYFCFDLDKGVPTEFDNDKYGDICYMEGYKVFYSPMKVTKSGFLPMMKGFNFFEEDCNPRVKVKQPYLKIGDERSFCVKTDLDHYYKIGIIAIDDKTTHLIWTRTY